MVQVTANSVPLSLTAPTAQPTVLEGASTSINLGTLVDQGIGPWTVTVQWGDGQASTFSPSRPGRSPGAHTYAEEGFYTISDTVSRFDGGLASLTFPIVVADQPVIVETAPITSTEGAAIGNATVATFTDPGGPENLADYSATIAWGDGQTSAGTITYSAGVFSVLGNHTYSDEGSYTVSVAVTHDHLAPVTVTTQANITDAALTDTSATAVTGAR